MGVASATVGKADEVQSVTGSKSILRGAIFFLGGVADLAGTGTSGGDTQLRQEPLGQNEPGYQEESESNPLVHIYLDCRAR